MISQPQSSGFNPGATIDRVPERLLRILASMGAGREVAVIVSARLKHPLTAVVDEKALYLQPACGIYDLLLGASLLRTEIGRRRRNRTEAPVPAESESLRKSVEDLRRRFPGAITLPSCLGHEDPDPLPRVSAHNVEWAALGETRSPFLIGGIEGPGNMIVDGDDDVTVLRKWLKEGKVVLEDPLPPLELAIARIPVTMKVADAFPPDWERWQQRLKAVEESIDDASRCLASRSEDAERSPASAFSIEGVELEPGLLHDLFVGARRGEQVAAFRQLRSVPRSFNPDEHLAVLGFDLHSFRSADSDRRAPVALLLILIGVYDRLEVPLEVVAFDDYILSLDSGRRVYLHQPVILKESDAPLAGAFWTRFTRSLARSGTVHRDGFHPAAYHALQFKTLSERAQRLLVDRDAHTLMFDYAGVAGVGDHWHRRPSWFADVAHAVETIVKDLDAAVGASVMGVHYIPAWLKDHTQPGSLLDEMSLAAPD